MAIHNVKCLYCGMVFDARPQDKDIVWFKPRSNRYAHVKCKDRADGCITKEDKEFDELYRYVKKEQGDNFNFVQFKKVTDAWKRDYGYSYSGMLKSLLYFYEVKKNSKKKLKEGSIGIIPFCYQQAYQYYYNIYLASQRAGTGDYNTEKKSEVEISVPESKRPLPKLFDL